MEQATGAGLCARGTLLHDHDRCALCFARDERCGGRRLRRAIHKASRMERTSQSAAVRARCPPHGMPRRTSRLNQRACVLPCRRGGSTATLPRRSSATHTHRGTRAVRCNKHQAATGIAAFNWQLAQSARKSNGYAVFAGNRRNGWAYSRVLPSAGRRQRAASRCAALPRPPRA
jgi:hypothetical protein